MNMPWALVLLWLFALPISYGASEKTVVDPNKTTPQKRVAIDAAHGNFHTADGRYAGFARLLEKHGYQVISATEAISESTLAKIDVLVIANALHPNNIDSWADPILDAFTENEISLLRDWVRQGGALLLIADHYPFPGAVAELAASFGFEFANGFAFRSTPLAVDLFERRLGTLHDHPITRSTTTQPAIDVVASFTGTGFKIPPDAKPLMQLIDDFTIWLPNRSWDFSERTPRITATGYFQGATLDYGEGRIAVFGEAAMFTDQASGGFHSPIAPQNADFITNTLDWLSSSISRR